MPLGLEPVSAGPLAAAPAAPAPPPLPVPPAAPGPLVITGPEVIDEDTLEAIHALWLAAGDVTPLEVIDEDTLEAVRLLWEDDAVQLPALFTQGPMTGRLKTPQAMPYAQIACEPDHRDLAGTLGAWHDWRKVTITIYGVKADVVAAGRAVLAVFNNRTVLTYPSGARFIRWLPEGELKLVQDPDTKSGLDVWQGIISARVWSVRTH